MIKEPMLAAKMNSLEELLEVLPYPALASPKLDGIRAIVSDHQGVPRLYSRKLKLIPNRYCQMLFGDERFLGLDGELIVGLPTGEGVFQRTTSGVMSADGEPNVRYYVFDDFTESGAFETRLDVVKIKTLCFPEARLSFVPHSTVANAEQARVYYDKCIEHEYEGAMYRHPQGLYKQGRSTVKQGWLFKMKEWDDAEATVLEVYELMHNSNEATTNELGRTKRSSHQAGMVGRGTLGGFACKTPDGRIFSLGGGPGLTADERARLWAIRASLPGKVVKYTSLRCGVKILPRHPQFLGFRED